MLGKRTRGPMKRTTSMSGITVDPGYVEGAGPSDANSAVINGQESCAVAETAEFLRMCGLCKRRLAPTRDIYMYRGDTAFCSEECRERQMKRDEKNKCSTVSAKKDANHHHSHHHSTMPAATTSSEAWN